MRMSRMPSVYIPVEPEGNGLGMPLLFSVLIHAGIIGFVFFTHRVPDMDIPASIETSIVTPEQLAAMQADVRANRAAAQSGSQAQLADQVYDVAINTTDSQFNNITNQSSATQQSHELSRHSVPDFVPSNDAAPSEADSRLDATDIKSLDYEKRRQIFNEQMEQKANQNIQSYAEEIATQREQERPQVNEYK